MVFYLLLPLWAAGLFLVRKRAWPVTYTAASMVAIAWFQWALLRHWPSIAIPPGEFADVDQRLAASWLPGTNPIGLFAHFLFGCAAGGFVALRSPARRQAGSPGRERGHLGFNRYDSMALLSALGIAADLGWRYAVRSGSAAGLWSAFEYRALWWVPYRWPIFPALVAAMLVALCRSGRLGRRLDNGFCTLTARLSFGIYLWHMPLIILLGRIWPDLARASTASQFGFAMTVALLSYAVAAVSYACVERPALDFVHRARSARASAAVWKPPTLAPRPLYVEIPHLERVFLDELTAGLDFVSHQDAEQVVGGAGVGHRDL
jgi:peptidoglycan/LPS O-acetylase OafA/YrhL